MKLNLAVFLSCAALSSSHVRSRSVKETVTLHEDDGFWDRILQNPGGGSMPTSAPTEAPVPRPTFAPTPGTAPLAPTPIGNDLTTYQIITEILDPPNVWLPRLVDSIDGATLLDNPDFFHTLFAPTDNALITALGEDYLLTLLGDQWSAHTSCLLFNHIVATFVDPTSDWNEGQELTSLNELLTLGVNPPSVNGLKVSDPFDVSAINGIVQSLNTSPILSDCVTKNIFEFGLEAENFTTLLQLVLIAGLEDDSRSKRPLTIFAPTNEAFKKLPIEVLDFLLENPMELQAVLTYHALGQNLILTDGASAGVYETLEGSTFEVTVDSAGIFSINGDSMVSPDFQNTLAMNGVIQVIDTVLIPPGFTIPTAAPVLPATPAPVAATPAPVVPATPAPVTPDTPAPVIPVTPSPVAPDTPAPVVPATPAPVTPDTPAPVVPATPAPVVPATPAPVVPATPAPVVPVTPAPVVPVTSAPVVPVTPAPVVPVTPAPVVPITPAPVTPDTPAPVVPATPAPVTPDTPAPVAITPAPVTPAPTPALVTVAPTSSIRALISTVALQGGAEFDDPNSYQSRALAFLEDTLSPQSDDQYIRYYSLASIFFASSGVMNEFTNVQFPNLDPLPGWITRDGWVTDSNFCGWFGITCDGNGFPTFLELPNNRMFGIFAPEVQLIADSLQIIELFNNFFLTTIDDGDAGNDWIAKMVNLRFLFFGTTSFQYPGIPTFINQIPTLEEIDFSNTFYTEGPIRGEAFAGTPALNYVDFGDNTYTSTIPAEFTALPSVLFFYLDNCEFQGVDQTLDFIIGMPSIFENWMDFTLFSGSIPTEIGTVSTLSSWSLTFCGLTGPIPSELGNLGSTLDRLWLYQNQLTGTIPTEIGNLGRMQFLYFEGNLLTGSMPAEICFNRVPLALLSELGADCNADATSVVACDCCTCCGQDECGDFA